MLRLFQLTSPVSAVDIERIARLCRHTQCFYPLLELGIHRPCDLGAG